MKKFIYGAVLASVLLVGCQATKEEVKKEEVKVETKVEETTKEVKDQGENGYSRISADRVKEKIVAKEDFMFSISADTCSTCKALKEWAAKQDAALLKNFVYVELNDTPEEVAKIRELYPELVGTPTILRVVDGNIEEVILGLDEPRLLVALDKNSKATNEK